MKVKRQLRGQRGAKRLDLSDMRAALRDQRQWCEIALVVAPTDGSPHWRIETDGSGNAIDVVVEVVTQPGLVPLTARLASGIWQVPALGEEVVVVIPAGEISFAPVIVALLSSNSVPNTGGQGPDPTRIVIVRGSVLIHDGAGGAEPLVRKSDFDGHTHPPGTFNAPGGGGPVTGVSGGAASVPGTSVLKAK